LRPEAGLTLVELIVVVALIGMLIGFGSGQFSSLAGWRSQGAVRKFAATWEFVFREATARGETYVLLLDMEGGRYAVRRMLYSTERPVKKADTLKNLRLDSERRRLAEKALATLATPEEEQTHEAAEQGGDLERLMFVSLYPPATVETGLARPSEFPSLAEPQGLGEGIEFSAVKLHGSVQEKGLVSIRLLPGGQSDPAVIYLDVDGRPWTITQNPFSGEVRVLKGHIDVDWGGAPSTRDT
jgi:prepilin-type N-terminal cleavage/methylation domain-containing protein